MDKHLDCKRCKYYDEEQLVSYGDIHEHCLQDICIYCAEARGKCDFFEDKEGDLNEK